MRRGKRVWLWVAVGLCAITGAGAQPVAAAPSNDDFANAAVLVAGGSLGGSLMTDNTGATKEPGEPNHAGDQGGASLWYAWTPSFSGTASIDTAGSSIDTLLGVYTGSSVSALTTIGSNDDISSVDTTSRVCFSAVAATTYLIAVDGYDDDEGAITLTYGPKNDAAPCPTLPPTITGPTSPKPGDALGSAPAMFATAGGATVSYQWERCVEQLCTDISGATNTSYAVQSQDVGYDLRVEESLTTSSGSAIEDSAPTMPVSVIPTTHANGRIYFVTKTGSASFRIDSMLPDGTGLLPLTGLGAVPNFATEPAISPDGSKVAFVNFSISSHIEVMNADGSGVQDLGVSGTYPSWSPDGSRIAFLKGDGIYVVDRSGGNPTLLVRLPAGAEGLAWSPDGTKLAFDMYVPIPGSNASQRDIMVASADGTGSVVDLTNTIATDDEWPSWSPTGQRIAFDQAPDGVGGQIGLAVMDANGANATQLYSGDLSHQPEFGTAWSPDGTKVLFSNFMNGSSQLFTVPSGGGPATQLAGDGYQNELMSWGVPFTPSGGGGGGGVGGSGGGGGGGGGGGSSSVTVSLTPGTQTLGAGGTAVFTIVVTNTGGAYLYAVQLSDPAVPACGNPPGSASDTLYLMAPSVTVTYSCSLSGVSANFTNTITVTATTGPGPIISQTASAAVNVQPAATPTPSRPSAPPARAPSSSVAGSTTFTISGLKPVHLSSKHPVIALTITLTKGARLKISLLSPKGKHLSSWTRDEPQGKHILLLPVPKKFRHAGHDELRIGATGNAKTKTLSLTLED
jgi:hypothetical protein